MGIGPLLKQDVGWAIWPKGFGHAGMFAPHEKEMYLKCWGPWPRWRLRVLSNPFRLGEYRTESTICANCFHTSSSALGPRRAPHGASFCSRELSEQLPQFYLGMLPFPQAQELGSGLHEGVPGATGRELRGSKGV